MPIPPPLFIHFHTGRSATLADCLSWRSKQWPCLCGGQYTLKWCCNPLQRELLLATVPKVSAAQCFPYGGGSSTILLLVCRRRHPKQTQSICIVPDMLSKQGVSCSPGFLNGFTQSFRNGQIVNASQLSRSFVFDMLVFKPSRLRNVSELVCGWVCLCARDFGWWCWCSMH